MRRLLFAALILILALVIGPPLLLAGAIADWMER